MLMEWKTEYYKSEKIFPMYSEKWHISPMYTQNLSKLAFFLFKKKKHIDKLNEYIGRQRTLNSQTILKEKNKYRGLTQTNFKT